MIYIRRTVRHIISSLKEDWRFISSLNESIISVDIYYLLHARTYVAVEFLNRLIDIQIISTYLKKTNFIY